MFAHLHVRSWFSFLAGGSSPEALVRRAKRLGMQALALTDRQGVYGAVRFQKACREAGIKPIFGAEVTVEEDPLVLLAASRDGYANLCELLTGAHLRGEDSPHVTVPEVKERAEDLFCLAGGRRSRLSRLLDERGRGAGAEWLDRLLRVFGERLSVEVSHHLLPGDNRRMQRLRRVAEAKDVPLAATGEVLYAVPDDYSVYDLLTCVRQGITVFDSCKERPRNAEAYLKSEEALRRLIPFGEAFDRAAVIARQCSVDLLPGHIATPRARYEGKAAPGERLEELCRIGLEEKYGEEQRQEAEGQLQRELRTIRRLKLSEFFLVAHEIVAEARRRGIRCKGRGSAANSIVAYLLGITGVDPIEHGLLFERFLHGGRKSTPDIDVDFDAERREEIIQWMEERFGREQTAMTATLVTYRLRSALRDVAKALGWPAEEVNELTKLVPRRRAERAPDYRDRIQRHLGPSPLVDVLIRMTAALEGCPRHLGLHVGGMILSRRPLRYFTPIQRSANGVRMAQFDKRDVEALGLVKFDVLGLRMLSAVSEATELAGRHEGEALTLDELPLDDEATFAMIRRGETLGVFQIESQGQMHLLARHQPETFQDLINEIALFRPGPLQGKMVHPFIRRRKGEKPVRYDHPDLQPILEDTYGVILFQEQVLEIAHRFAGMPLAEADDFRALMSRFRDPGEMEEMKKCFVDGACRRGVPYGTARRVFDKLSNFVGYGFCRSHAAAFAETVYQSAYLKRHHPAAFMAALMQHRPGMYDLMTLEEEARRFGVEVLLPDVNRSGIRYDLEHRGDDALAIRKPLTAVTGLSKEDARTMVLERLKGNYQNIEDLWHRVRLDVDVFRGLVRSGALDGLEGSSREALWKVGLLEERGVKPGPQRQHALFGPARLPPEEVPELPRLSRAERISWDYETHGAAREHPMRLVRRRLADLEIRPIETCYRFRPATDQNNPVLTVAGLTILRQKPPTANGVMFLTLEDETGFIQCITPPKVQQYLDHVLMRPALIVRGRLQVDGSWRGLLVCEAWPLDGLMGGYEGHPSSEGGRDRWVRKAGETDASHRSSKQ